MAAVEPLTGYTIALTAARRREELGAALERRGAKIIHAPAIRIVPLADDTQLREATERCLAAPVDIVVATTGIGYRGWMDAAEAWGLADELISAMKAADLLARGPKARGAIRATGLHEVWSPASESSAEVLSYLTEQGGLRGKRIAVQLHGEPLPDMVESLRAAGADVIEVPVYRWVPAEDMNPVRRVVEAVSARTVDAVAFTSAPAAASFLQTADEMSLYMAVARAMRDSVLAACVGPVTAAPLQRAGIPCVIPPRGRLGALVREIVETLPAARGMTLQVADHTLQIRGHAAVVDGRVLSLPAASMTLLRALAAKPGHVCTRAGLLRLTGTTDEHALEVAVGRLRTSLGDPAMIRTVVKRGYRLDCIAEPDPCT
jgi:uroporphyrinogen-III synthase